MEQEYYSKVRVKGLGFTDKMIDELLPEPILKTNPHYKCAAPMKLWRIDDVNAAMESDAFKRGCEASVVRRKGAAKAVETKRKNLHEEVLETIQDIRVRKIDFNDLLDKTLAAKELWYGYQSELHNGEWSGEGSTRTADEETRHRWMVNYVRHNLTNYEEELYYMSGKVGCHEEYYFYKDAVLDRIAETYPELEDACRRQKECVTN